MLASLAFFYHFILVAVIASFKLVTSLLLSCLHFFYSTVTGVTFEPTFTFSITEFFSTNILTFFSFYLFSLVASTILTSYLGVYGVYYACNVSLALVWISLAFSCGTYVLDGTITLFASSKSLLFSSLVSMDLSILIDTLSFSFLFLVASIGLCAVFYSLSYFKNEPHADRFVILLHWFIISMSLLVAADNVFLMFLGWELIGLTSFLLINFWTLRRGTLKSAIKAFSFNKLSDIFILLFIVLMVQKTQACNFSVWLQLFNLGVIGGESFWWPILFLILGSSIKSAQIIGHLWLPDSMEAPIPASALIHSATLVSAGVYLLTRFNDLLASTGLNSFVIVLGSLTAFYGVLVSSSQTDLKRLLAYSTISHCGFLFVTTGFGNLYLTLVYLYLHGFFKALTFFCVGNFVKYCRGYQDSRMMGSYSQIFPIESILFLICSINLGGLPFTVGFSYKHLVKLYLSTNNTNLFVVTLLSLSMILGLVYVYRLVYYVLFDIKKGSEAHYTSGFSNQLNHVELTESSFETHASSSHSSTIKTSISTPVSIIGISLLLSLSFVYYYFYLNWPLATETTTLIVSDSTTFLAGTNNFSSGFVLYFFSIFGAVILFLFFTEVRVEFSSLYRRHLGIFFFFFVALTIILFFIL